MINKIISRIIIDHPWFASLVLKLKLVEDKNIPTMATDGKCLFFNEKFLETLKKDEAVGAIIHEVMHCAMLHCIRRMHREHNKWNTACDYAVNSILLECGLTLPKGHLYEKKYEKMSAEQIYDILPKVKSSHICVIDGKYDKVEIREWKKDFAETIIFAKKRGIKSESLDRILEELAKSETDWRELLHRSIRCRFGHDDYSWNRISRRGLSIGMLLPSLTGLRCGHLCIIVDTSSSMNEEELSYAVKEIRSAADFCEYLTIIESDCKILRETSLYSFEEFNPISLKGGGGTDFKPALDRAKELETETIVYITDMECHFPNENGLDTKTIWLTQSQKIAPWGLTVKMGDKNENKHS